MSGKKGREKNIASSSWELLKKKKDSKRKIKKNSWRATTSLDPNEATSWTTWWGQSKEPVEETNWCNGQTR